MFTIKEILEATGSRLLKGSPKIEAAGVSIDSRTAKKGDLFIAIKGINFDGHNFINEAVKKGISCLLVSDNSHNFENVKIPVIKAQDSTKALIALAMFHRNRFKMPIIAVTGSNGKTTTKELIAHCLSLKFNVFKNYANQNNKFGVALNLFKLNSSYDIAVLEIGTNNFGEIKYLSEILRPNIGVITNIGPSHLEGLGDVRGVFKEKISLLNSLIKPKIAFLNSDDLLLNRFINKKGACLLASRRSRGPAGSKQFFSFGYKNKADFKIKNLKFNDNKLFFKINNCKFVLNTVARHNIYNALAAISVARIFGINYRELSECFNNFNWLDGRFKVHILGNTHIIDDSYNANPLSFSSALETFERYSIKSPPKARSRHFVAERKILIMADMLELGNFTEKYHLDLAKKIKNSPIDLFIGLGEYSKKIADFLKKNSEINSCGVDNIGDILNILKIELDSKPISILIKGSHAFKLENVILHILSTT